MDVWTFETYMYFFFLWRCGPTRAMASFLRLLDHTQQRRITVGRTPLDEWSARRRDLHLTTHNTHNRQTSKPPVGFEPTISEGELPQTYALDRTATGTGRYMYRENKIYIKTVWRLNCKYIISQNYFTSYAGACWVTLYWNTGDVGCFCWCTAADGICGCSREYFLLQKL